MADMVLHLTAISILVGYLFVIRFFMTSRPSPRIRAMKWYFVAIGVVSLYHLIGEIAYLAEQKEISRMILGRPTRGLVSRGIMLPAVFYLAYALWRIQPIPGEKVHD